MAYGLRLRVLKNLAHLAESVLAQIWYRFPVRELTLIGVTGTKGKSTVLYMLREALRAANQKCGLISTIGIDVGAGFKESELHMSMPGRFTLQRLLRQMVKNNCRYGLVEITSQGILQWRHLGLRLQILVITNLQKEHIEAHGSFAAYRETKARALKLLVSSGTLVLNTECAHAPYYHEKVKNRPFNVSYFKTDDWQLPLLLPGEFNRANAAAAMVTLRALSISETSLKAISKISRIPGRMEQIENKLGITIIVDYAHTVDSLGAALTAAKQMVQPGHKLIAVFGSMGEGRDRWARAEKGKVAAEVADQIVLTEEESGLHESAEKIMDDIAKGISEKGVIVEKIVDRRSAIRYATESAEPGDVVIITGMGNLSQMIKNGAQIPWDDRQVVREVLNNL